MAATYYVALSIFAFGASIYLLYSTVLLQNNCDRCEMSFMATEFQDLTAEFLASMPNLHSITYPVKFCNEKVGMPTKRLDCIPALFIPGSAGSGLQARSLSSWASEPPSTGSTVLSNKYCIAFYAIDFFEELSGLSGQILERQIDYAKTVAIWISTLHSRHDIMFIIGHSMGGVVARSISQDERINIPTLVSITLATPHLVPPLSLDRKLNQIYKEINSKPAYSQQQRAIISIGSGEYDVQVHPYKSKFRDCTAFCTSSSVPLAWSLTNHQSIVWSHGLVRQISRFLWRLVETASTGQLTSSKIMDMSNHYFKGPLMI